MLYTFNVSTSREIIEAATTEVLRAQSPSEHNPAARSVCCSILLAEIAKRVPRSKWNADLAEYVPALESALETWSALPAWENIPGLW